MNEEEEKEELRKRAMHALGERDRAIEERARALEKRKAVWKECTDKQGRTVPAYRGQIIVEDFKELESKYPPPYGKMHLTLGWAYEDYKRLVKELDKCDSKRSDCKSNLEACLKRLKAKA